METFESFERLIYTVNESNFDQIALQLFQFQALHNPVYQEYLKNLGVGIQNVKTTSDIPFLPISLFKSRLVKTGNWSEDIIFSSSGTTGTTTSYHPARKEFYLRNSVHCFENFFGSPSDYTLIALLPGYLDRPGSSLITMVDHFVKAGNKKASGFYRNGDASFYDAVELVRRERTKTIVWAVTFALLDLADRGADLSHCIVVETGGMKGMRAEITRDELHSILSNRLNVSVIHSEYGMTELMSQAYSHGHGIFESPPWMRVLVRDTEDPLARLPAGRVGGINVIDLANIYSCAFVETQDLGRVVEKGGFEVLGRLDNSDIRGCNLLG